MAIEKALGQRGPSLAEVRLQVPFGFVDLPIEPRQGKADLSLARIMSTTALQPLLASQTVATGAVAA